MWDQLRDVGLGCSYAFLAAIWSLGAMYLEKYLDASVGEVLFVGCMVSWLLLSVYIVSNPVARQESYRFYLFFCQMFQSNNNNNDNNIVTNEMINVRIYFCGIIIRSILSNISVTLMLLAISISGSVANLHAIYRILQLLFAIFVSYLLIKDKNKRNVSVFTLLVIVPRHPERLGDILSDIPLSLVRIAIRSKEDKIRNNTQIYIADTIGELENFMQHCEFVFMGGSLVDHGGQNFLEAASLGKSIIVGPYMYNFIDETEEFLKNNSMIMVKNSKSLKHVFERLLKSKQRRDLFGDNAKNLLQKKTKLLEDYYSAIKRNIL